MESPSRIIMHVSTDDKDKMLSALDFLVSIKRAFYYSPNDCGIRIRTRSRYVLGKIEREMRGLGMTIRKHYE